MVPRSAILVVISSLAMLAPAVASAQRKPRHRPIVQRPARLDVGKIVFSKNTSNAKDKLTPPRASRAGRAPAPLPRAERVRALAQIRALAVEAGVRVVVQPAPAPQPTPDPPVDDTIVLTPDAPRVGNNWMHVTLGDSAPGGFDMSGNSPALDLRTYGYYRVHYGGLVTGGVYMLDCTVQNSVNRVWALSGPASAQLKPQAGHLLFGFVASSSATTIQLIPDNTINVRLFRCELTRAG